MLTRKDIPITLVEYFLKDKQRLQERTYEIEDDRTHDILFFTEEDDPDESLVTIESLLEVCTNITTEMNKTLELTFNPVIFCPWRLVFKQIMSPLSDIRDYCATVDEFEKQTAEIERIANRSMVNIPTDWFDKPWVHPTEQVVYFDTKISYVLFQGYKYLIEHQTGTYLSSSF